MLFNVHLSASFAVVSGYSGHFYYFRTELCSKNCQHILIAISAKHVFAEIKDLVCFGILVNVNQKLNIARIANLNQQKN